MNVVANVRISNIGEIPLSEKLRSMIILEETRDEHDLMNLKGRK